MTLQSAVDHSISTTGPEESAKDLSLDDGASLPPAESPAIPFTEFQGLGLVDKLVEGLLSQSKLLEYI